MTDPAYVPFGESKEEYTTLVDGVPEWLRPSLLDWIMQELSSRSSGRWLSAQKCLDVQVNTRVSLGIRGNISTYIDSQTVFKPLHALDAQELLRITDYLIYRRGEKYRSASVERLDRILLGARSKWSVGEEDGHLRLVAREWEGLRQSVEAVLSADHEATTLLARAWSRIHALQPDFSGAYSDAVRAVEIVSVGEVLPNKADATLGDVGGAISGDTAWQIPLREHRKAPSNDVLAGMLRTLYSGHRDRHGRPDYTEVSLEETRAAVLLAATLVEWFISGGVARREAS